MNAKNGKTKWKWDEVQNLWGNKTVNSGGGQWDPPSFDAHGNLYVGVANPAPFPGTNKYPFGSSRPGDNLYTDSIVKLNDEDRQDDVVLPADAARPRRLGLGELADPDHGGRRPDRDRRRQGRDRDRGRRFDRQAAVEAPGRGPQRPMPTSARLAAKNPSKYKLPITVEPGELGGIESQLASNGKTVFAAVNDLAVKYTAQNAITGGAHLDPFKGKGELVAINQANGKILWDHHFRALRLTVPCRSTNDVAFTTTFDGTLWALNTSNGKVLWHKQLSAGTNTPVTINGNMVITGGTFPAWQGADRPDPGVHAHSGRLARRHGLEMGRGHEGARGPSRVVRSHPNQMGTYVRPCMSNSTAIRPSRSSMGPRCPTS